MSKLCRDCKYFRAASGDTWDHTDTCSATIVKSPDLVHGGSRVTGYETAQVMRKEGRECGPEGNLWMAKPPRPPILPSFFSAFVSRVMLRH